MRAVAAILLAFLAVGCSREKAETGGARELSPAVKEAVYRICKLERVSPADHSAKVLDVRGMSAADFRKALESFPGREVHVWMPGERDWLLVGSETTNRVSLAAALEAFAADQACTTSLPEVFASYVGTREEVLPAFKADLKGDVLPEWFVTKEVPEIRWLDTAGIDADILSAIRAEIRSVQVVRRLVLEGNMLAAKAKDKPSEEASIACWSRAALRNPNDPMILERMENLNRNAKAFLEAGKVVQAMKCFETIVLIRADDAAAVHNFGLCLKRIGKTELAEKVLKRGDELAERGNQGKVGKDGSQTDFR